MLCINFFIQSALFEKISTTFHEFHVKYVLHYTYMK
jgi:hypothetical protein